MNAAILLLICASLLATEEAQEFMRQAEAAGTTDDRRALYLKAIGRFYSTTGKLETEPLARALIEVGKIDNDQVMLLQAVEYLREIVRANPENGEARARLAEAYELLGQTNLATATERPESALQSGIALQRAAEKLDPQPEAIALYQQANAKFSKAVTDRPDNCLAQRLWARNLSRLSRLATNASDRVTLTQSARDRFATASRCSGTDWRVHYEWARLLTMEADVNPRAAAALLREAQGLYDRSLTLALSRGDKAKIEHDSGMCLVLLAEQTPADEERRSLYRKAITRINSAVEVPEQTMTAHSFGLWGVALLQLSKLENDRFLTRQAVERLLSALRLDPGNNAARYNLVCAYALLDQTDNALRHLKTCLQNDPQGIYYKSAAQDKDLWSLRRTAEFNALFGSPPGNSDSFNQTVLPK